MPWSKTRPRSSEYGSTHTKARKQWATQHQPEHTCNRCGQPLGPLGPWLHLDHDDNDRSRYRGFAHADCNRRAGARAGRAKQETWPRLRW